MTAPTEHRAVAQRGQYGDRDLWRAVCRCGFYRGADSKQDAERKAEDHQAAVTCSCYDVATMEYAPTPCTACAGGAA